MASILTITLNPALDLSVETPALNPGEVNRTGNTWLEPAGKGINVARVLARLGHSVTVTGLLGEANAAPFERLFEAEGLQDRFVRIAGQNRINIKIAEAGGRVTDLNGPVSRPLTMPGNALKTGWQRCWPTLMPWSWPGVCPRASHRLRWQAWSGWPNVPANQYGSTAVARASGRVSQVGPLLSNPTLTSCRSGRAGR